MIDKTEFRADFDQHLADRGQALNDDGCIVPANTRGNGQPCECPCHQAGGHQPHVSGPAVHNGYYRASCDCGWRGSQWSRRGSAVAEYERHLTGG